MAVRGILLAAGQGRRFGGNKLLHPLGNGVPLALQAARTLQQALPGALAVVDARDDELIERLGEEGMPVVLNHQATDGMGTSIACGVRASAEAAGWVIALADMPCLRVETIRAVAAAITAPNRIGAPLYRGRRGHPVGFGSDYLEALSQLSADEGARHIIAANRQFLQLVTTDDPGVLTDIDCRADLASLAAGAAAGL